MTPHHGWLITGGTGFIGRALAQHLLEHKITERVCIYSRNEFQQERMRRDFHNDDRLRWFIGDVRDFDRLRYALQSVEVVVHAAALKRVEVGVYNPIEMVKTNIAGTQNVIMGAIDAGCRAVVHVSTDKAVEPLNCYGASKLVAEKLMLAGAEMAGHRYPSFSVVRYGNVAGSTGSVIPLWRDAIAKGHRLVVTDPDATRFWITAAEAVQLIMQAAEKGHAKPIVPDLNAYRVGDLALAVATGRMPEYYVIGLQQDEKKHELLLSHHDEGGPRSSKDAPRMSIDTLERELARLKL